jgi:hypothetical protein
MVVMDFLHRWLFVDFFVPVWPNIAAAAICMVHVTNSNRKNNDRPTKRILGLHFYIGSGKGDDDEEGQA